ncbi:hypothetical protein ACIRSS_18060 [Amycolatopsis sp. NPDC101161]|uniref:hypothetical protein n=1 Tax=Amycolatopsis sp. NPDC101161 TaxID=3363940 RepID=UPI0038157013
MHYAKIALGTSIHSSNDFLEEVYATRIASVAYEVVPPRGSVEDESLYAPTDSWKDDRPWGIYYSKKAFVECLGLIAQDQDLTSRQLDKVAAALPLWVELLIGWLSVLSDDVGSFVSSFTPTIARTGDFANGIPTYTERGVNVHSPKLAVAKEWRYALEKAGNLEEPPMARVLLIASRRALYEREWRTVVVDCATAAEVALTRAVTDAVNGMADGRVAGLLLSKSMTLGGLFGMAEKLDLKVPNNWNKKLVQVRNTVVHAGRRVTESEAKAAMEIAADVVDAYSPQPRI